MTPFRRRLPSDETQGIGEKEPLAKKILKSLDAE
jgi:hypothetical protein